MRSSCVEWDPRGLGYPQDLDRVGSHAKQSPHGFSERPCRGCRLLTILSWIIAAVAFANDCEASCHGVGACGQIAAVVETLHL